jgi:hypothetical protein
VVRQTAAKDKKPASGEWFASLGLEPGGVRSRKSEPVLGRMGRLWVAAEREGSSVMKEPRLLMLSVDSVIVVYELFVARGPRIAWKWYGNL